MINVADIHPPCDTLLAPDGTSATSAGMVLENRLTDDGRVHIVTVLHAGETTFHQFSVGARVLIARRSDCCCG